MLAVLHCLLYALIVVFIVLLWQGHLLHKGPVGGRSLEGCCCWQDFKNPFSFSLEEMQDITFKIIIVTNELSGENHKRDIRVDA